MMDDHPGTFEGYYLICNSSTKTYLGISSDQSLAVAQDKFEATQTLRDLSQIWLAELCSDGLSFNFRNAQTGQVLDVKESAIDSEDGVSVILCNNTGNPSQQWKVERTSDWTDDPRQRPCYRLFNLSTKKVLHQTTNPGWPAVSWTLNGGKNQLWSLQFPPLPVLYRIGNVSSGRYLRYDTFNGAATTAKIPSTDKSLGQFWFLDHYWIDDSKRFDFIRNVQDDKKVLDLFESSIDQGNSIIAYDYHGGRNQQWQLNYSNNTETDKSNNTESNSDNTESDSWISIDQPAERVRIVSALGSVAIQENSANKLEARNLSNDSSQYWDVEQYFMPPFFWTTIQNLKSGTFLAQDEKNQTQVIPSTGSQNALNYTIHWHFVPQPNQPFHHFMIVNRATGWVLVGSTESPSIYAAPRDQVQTGHLWAIDTTGDGIGIFNTTTLGVLDHHVAEKIEALPYSDWADNPLRQWIVCECYDRTSFAIVNARTGRFINFVSASETNGVKTDDKGIPDFRNQWCIKDPFDSEDGLFIINKASGMVLDHFDGSRIEAYTDDTVNDLHHHWKIMACSERYFQIVNVATGRYLEERTTGTPNANAIEPVDMSEDDRSQCWKIVTPFGAKYCIRR